MARGSTEDTGLNHWLGRLEINYRVKILVDTEGLPVPCLICDWRSVATKKHLEKITGSPSQRLAQQGPGGCQRPTAVYAVEICRSPGVMERRNGPLGLRDDDDESGVHWSL